MADNIKYQLNSMEAFEDNNVNGFEILQSNWVGLLSTYHYTTIPNSIKCQNIKMIDIFESLVKATVTRCDLSATILFKLVDSYLIAFKFAQ